MNYTTNRSKIIFTYKYYNLIIIKYKSNYLCRLLLSDNKHKTITILEIMNTSSKLVKKAIFTISKLDKRTGDF